MDASCFINMETIRMSKVMRPFNNSSYKISSVAVAKIGVVVDLALSDDLCCIPGPLPLSWNTWWCLYFFAVSESTHEGEYMALEGHCVSSKTLEGSKTEMRELLVGKEENSGSPTMGYWFAQKAKQWSFAYLAHIFGCVTRRKESYSIMDSRCFQSPS